MVKRGLRRSLPQIWRARRQRSATGADSCVIHSDMVSALRRQHQLQLRNDGSTREALSLAVFTAGADLSQL